MVETFNTQSPRSQTKQLKIVEPEQRSSFFNLFYRGTSDDSLEKSTVDDSEGLDSTALVREDSTESVSKADSHHHVWCLSSSCMLQANTLWTSDHSGHDGVLFQCTYGKLRGPEYRVNVANTTFTELLDGASATAETNHDARVRQHKSCGLG